ncbi:autotransporter domain-containing protein [Halomonas kenyensis]|uniref:Autotransporter domain-containing protein n=1 Tax=Billgrantia kenyensis TaxID=321266 RepID=A0ABS9PN94_9GAMM|nr:autotransporter domain-containing protein [Halomonas kenyensis]
MTGEGSRLSSNQSIIVGYPGTGTLTISDGAGVDAGESYYLGLGWSGGDGTLNIGQGGAPGVVNAPTVRGGGGTATLNFNHSGDDYHFTRDGTANGEAVAITTTHTVHGTTSVNHLGSGTTTLSGSHAYYGPTTISDGRLLVNGTIASSVLTRVRDGAILGGSGTVGDTLVESGGILAPGNSIGTLTVDGDLTLESGAISEFELGTSGSAADPASGASDRVNVAGDLAFNGTLNLSQSDESDDGTVGLGYYRLMTYGGELTANTATIGTTPSLPHADLYELQAGEGRVDLFIGALGDDSLQHWQGGDGVWGATDTQWLNREGTAPAAWAGQHAIFKDAGGFNGGTIEVEGAQSFAGLQFVDEGYRLEGAGQLVTEANGSEIRVLADQATIATEITGSGGLTKTEAGTLTLTGTNTYTGGTTVNAGTLVVAAGGSITGDATVNGGRFDVDGEIDGEVTVNAGGFLGGSGTLGELRAGSGSVVQPGNSIGTLNVAGNYTLGSGATYEVELRGGGNTPGVHNDLIAVAGAATLEEGSLIHVTPENGSDDGSSGYADGTTYTILTSGGGLSVAGAGPVISDDYAYLDFAGSFDADNYYLTSRLVDGTTTFCLAGQSSNQCAAGGGAFSLGAGNAVYDAVLNMSAAQAAAALDQLSGEGIASTQSALLTGSGLVRDSLMAHMRSAGNAPDGSDDPLWVSIVGANVAFDGDGDTADLDSREWGFLAGRDATLDRLGDDWRLGLSAGYTRTDASVDDRLTSGDSDNVHLGLYAGRQWGALGLRLGAAHSWHWIDTERHALGQELTGDTRGRTLQGFAELGYAFDTGAVSVEPFVNAAWVQQRISGFDESGSAAALSVDDATSETGFTTLGLRSTAPLALGDKEVTLNGSLGWRHALGDLEPQSTHAFAGGEPFTVSGTAIDRNAAVVETGLDLSLSDTTSLGVSYDGQFGNDTRAHAGGIRLTHRF